MSTLFRVEFWTEDDSHPSIMTAEEAREFVKSEGLTEYHSVAGVAKIDDLDDDDLARAVTAATTMWLDRQRGKWVRFIEKGLVEESIAAVRGDDVRFFRVSIEETRSRRDEDDGAEDDGDPVAVFRRLTPPADDWLN